MGLQACLQEQYVCVSEMFKEFLNRRPKHGKIGQIHIMYVLLIWQCGH